jgi:hypothetical protein
MTFKKGDKVKLTKDFPPKYKQGEIVDVTEVYEPLNFSTTYYEINDDITVEEGDIK